MNPNETPMPAATPSSEALSPEPLSFREAAKAALLAQAAKDLPRRKRSAAIVKSNDERTRLFKEFLRRNPGAREALGLKS